MNVKKNWFLLSGILALLPLLLTHSCKHDVTMPDGGTPIDTTGTGNPGDTITSGQICNPDSVYFENQILPILVSNCAQSGCHDARSAEDGVVLTSYDKVIQTAKVRAGRPTSSELYEVLVETGKDRMPPAPRNALPADQIQLISKWISQGARNNSCNPNAGGCETQNVSFARTLNPILQTNCKGCHSGSAPLGNIDLSNLTNVRNTINRGRFIGSISHQSGFSAMPQGGRKLSSCAIEQFKSWIDQGMPDN